MDHDHTKLKNLETQIRNIELEAKECNKEKEIINQKSSAIKNRLHSLKREHEKLTKKKKKITISEHAILRYFERIRGIDLESLKLEIMSEEQEKSIREFGNNGTFPIGETHRLVVKNNVVTTIVSTDKSKNK